MKRESVNLTLDIPAGVADGQRLRITGQGSAGKRGATAGDLYVLITVEPDKRFVRERNDIRSVVSIPVLDAILGTEIDVDTVHGSVKLKIPAGTQPHHVMRLKAKGLPELNSSRLGDHFVTVNIEVPKKLSRAEKKLMEEWKELTSP